MIPGVGKKTIHMVTVRSYDEMKKILVTGGAGFIGSHLCERLLAEGNEIICLDNLSTGSQANIRHLLNNKYFQFVEHDLIEPFFVEVDEIYNLACPASPLHYQADPIKTIKTCVYGVVNMLELAEKTGAKILQASTSEVYGAPKLHPQPETCWGYVNPIGVRSCYDEGKRIAETLFFDYYRQYQVRIKVMRIFNTYGPRMHPYDGRVVSNFIVQALKGEDLTVYGDGSQTRSFCFIDDLIEGMVRLMNSEAEVRGPINMGNPNEISILTLAEKIVELTNSQAKIVFQPLPQDDPQKRRPVITLAKQKLKWEPLVSLAEGLRKTIEYFRNLDL